MAGKVYSYIRWSTPEQRQGDSFRRQLERTRAYAAKQGMELDESLRDDGVSAFRGRNMRGGVNAGALGRFLERVQAGDVEPGSVLVVEDLDRMSRQAPDRALSGFLAVIHAGVAVHTTIDNRTYAEGALDLPHLIGALLGFARANQESERKSDRLREVWEEKRRNAGTRPMTGTGPSWLRLDRGANAWVVIPERAEVVRRIFADALAGKGLQRIAEELNTEGVPVFQRGTRAAQRWHRTTIAKILHSPTVVGTLVPNILTYSTTGTQRRVPQKDQTVKDYYPAVVDADTFAQVQALRLETNASPLRGKAAAGEVQNIFGGLLRCGRCGASVHRNSKSRSGGIYLICSAAKDGAGCKYEYVRYANIEAAFLQQAPRLLTDAPAGEAHDDLRKALQHAEARLSVNSDAVEQLAEERRRGNPAAARMGVELAKERRQLEAERDELMTRAAVAAGPFVSARIAELLDVLVTQPLDRTRGNALLRVLLQSIALDFDSGHLVLTWKAGGTSEVPVLAKAFGFTVEKAPSGRRSKRPNAVDQAPEGAPVSARTERGRRAAARKP
jgi:DNA invertase Pin-like site-specific DNA recombinase